ncbi:MAG TPA: carbamate kinase [Gemmatimonadales bacterium]|nr:carbamate kinase [Gemmatimonadales bacterium]
MNARTARPARPASAARKTRRASSAPAGTIVVALGGNAVAPPNERPTISNQFRHTRASLAPIVDLARDGWHIALVHGNGPQVGDDLARNELAADQVEPLPLGVLVAATAGWMGYMIQQSLQNALARAGIARQVVTLVTQTLCDANDPNLRQPTKPIGHALDPARLARLQARGVPVREEQPGRWRRLAPSPKPIAVVERDTVRHLVAAGHIVVACGGGGPPVYDDPMLRLEGIDAVADKDRVAAILGRDIAADVLLILTNVEAVYRAYGTPHQEAIRRLTLAQADHLLAGKELGAGSMRPKVEAAADFVRVGGSRAIIAALSQGLAALRGDAGTTITSEPS